MGSDHASLGGVAAVDGGSVGEVPRTVDSDDVGCDLAGIGGGSAPEAIIIYVFIVPPGNPLSSTTAIGVVNGLDANNIITSAARHHDLQHHRKQRP